MNDWDHIYLQKWFDMVLFCLLVVGGIVIGIDGFISKKLNIFLRVLFVMIGVAAIIKMFTRDYYLPFLGDTAFPCGSLMAKTPAKANREVHVYAPPYSTVIYWAAESAREVKDNPILAYAQNTNAGVAIADQAGRAILKVREPVGYYTGFRKLDSHIHYRICKSSGMIGSVQTHYLK